MEKIRFVFFGGEPLGVPVLEELKMAGLLPELIVCSQDKPVGRKQELTAPPVKIWAEANNIEVFQPTSYKDESTSEKIEAVNADVFVVVAYNKILPKWLLDLPKHGILNVHPSLLPKLRGASPIRTAIKDDLREDIGVTVMLLDEEMDHGPILDQLNMPISDENWPLPGPELDLALAQAGGALLAEVLPEWTVGNLDAQEQDHEAATYCGKFTKADSELEIDPFKLPGGSAARQAWLTINAFAGIGDTFFVHNDQRVKIKQAELTDGANLQLLRVTPEGKAEMDFDTYLESLNN
tara:strand:- start:10867 stop:11748 length:882 start_codon:yes stop_codon:yes gene_type:complete